MSGPRKHLLQLSGGVHLAALALTLLRPRWWPWGAAGIVANHALLATLSVMPRSTLLGPNLRGLHDRSEWRHRVALTFDDGPDPEVTPEVLEILRQRGVTASFFCVGERVRCNPEIVRQMAAEGHGVENHTTTHSSAFAFFGPRRAGREIEGASRAITEVTGRQPRYFRPPAGMRNPWLAPVVAARDMRLVSWTRRGFDAVVADPASVVSRLTRNLAGGDILLLHDGFGPRLHDGRPAVLEALPRVLTALDRAGLAASRLPNWDVD